jgi:hypothetical protein
MMKKERKKEWRKKEKRKKKKKKWMKKKRKKGKKEKNKNARWFFFAFIKILESFEDKSILNLFQPCAIR